MKVVSSWKGLLVLCSDLWSYLLLLSLAAVLVHVILIPSRSYLIKRPFGSQKCMFMFTTRSCSLQVGKCNMVIILPLCHTSLPNVYRLGILESKSKFCWIKSWGNNPEPMIQVTLSAYVHNTVSQVNLLLFLDIKWLRHLQVLAFGTSIILNATFAEPQQITSFTYWKEDVCVLAAFYFSWSHLNVTNKMTAYVNKHCHSRTQNCNTVLSKSIIWYQPRPATNKAVKWPQTHSVGCIEEIYPIATARYRTLAILVRPYHVPDPAMRAGSLQKSCYCVLKCHIYIGKQ